MSKPRMTRLEAWPLYIVKGKIATSCYKSVGVAMNIRAEARFNECMALRRNFWGDWTELRV